MSAGAMGAALRLAEMEGERISKAQDRRRRRLARKRRRIARNQRAAAARLDVTEDDLARTLLLAMAANQILQGKQVLSPTEIAQVSCRVDLWDGQTDGKLDPAVLRPEEPQEAESASSPREFLRQLEEEHQQ